MKERYSNMWLQIRWRIGIALSRKKANFFTRMVDGFVFYRLLCEALKVRCIGMLLRCIAVLLQKNLDLFPQVFIWYQFNFSPQEVPSCWIILMFTNIKT